MKFLLIAVFAILGYVGANCGCLKCSKHLTVLGEIPGAPGQVPIKVICRCEQGYPNVCDYVPVQPIAVQVPVPKPEPVPVCGGAKYSIKLKPFFKPYCEDGCYFGSGSITGPGAAGNPCAASGNVYDYSDYYGPIVPVKVQAPVPQPEHNKCFTLQGLQTAVDRIILPAPAICATGITPYDRYVTDKHHYGCGGCHHHHHHHCSSGCSSCHHRYDSQNLNSEPSKFPNLANQHSHSRSKRQILQHGYKFIVNMLPPFIQEPIKDTVNKMAITHPDKKLRKVYNLPPPPLTLKEKIELKHKENVAAVKNKLFGTPIKKTNTKPLQKTNKTSKVYDYETTKKKVYEPSKKHYKYTKSYVDDNVVEEEVGSFADSLRNPEQKKKKGFLRSRTALSQSDKKTDRNNSWLKEMKAADILGKHFSKKHRTDRMTAKEKALFLEKLQKLNQNSNKAKTTGDPLKTSKARSKRSIIIGSDELNLPLYQIKIRESEEEEENEIDQDYEYDDYDYDDDERVGMRSFDASKEELIRNAIREELKKFRQVQSEEELVGDPVSLFQDDKIGSKFPLLRILTFPMKLLKKVKNNEELPIVGAFPKMIVGTKKYFKDFGKNFKKNFLHFTSDIIGDFDHYGPSDNILANFIKPNRFRRSIDDSSNLNENSETQNFHNVSNAKVRKKRYILKMVDDDEIEELLRQKLGKMFDEPHKSHKPRRKHRNKPKKYHDSMEHKEHYKKRNKKHLDEFVGVQRKKRRPENKHMKKVKESSMEEFKKKIIVEQIKPKVIIDNNGLPFMEVNGYKRPLFMKNLIKDKENKEDNSIENSSFDNYDSSEEANLQKIHHVIDNAKQKQGIYSRNTEVPLETLKDKISELLHDIDTLVHMDFEKYDDVYDDLIEIQSVKTSIVQSWKRIIMDKKINDHNAKIGLLEKFTHLQHLKTKTMKTIVYVMSEDCENSFALEKVIHALMALHKIQCVIDQVVGCFQEKFKTGSKFEMAKEIKFVDFLASLKFVRAKTRNDMVCRLKEERDKELQECITLLEKLKKLLVEGDEASIEEEANILWEMKHVQKMQINTIEEMCDRLEEGLRIKKNMKVLFDLSKRLKALQEKENKICSGKLTKPSCEEEEDEEDEDDESEKEKKKVKKFDIEEFKKKWQDKVQKQKEQIEESFKKRMLKVKELKKKNKIVEEDDETEEDENVSEEDENE